MSDFECKDEFRAFAAEEEQEAADEVLSDVEKDRLSIREHCNDMIKTILSQIKEIDSFLDGLQADEYAELCRVKLDYIRTIETFLFLLTNTSIQLAPPQLMPPMPLGGRLIAASDIFGRPPIIDLSDEVSNMNQTAELLKMDIDLNSADGIRAQIDKMRNQIEYWEIYLKENFESLGE